MPCPHECRSKAPHANKPTCHLVARLSCTDGLPALFISLRCVWSVVSCENMRLIYYSTVLTLSREDFFFFFGGQIALQKEDGSDPRNLIYSPRQMGLMGTNDIHFTKHGMDKVESRIHAGSSKKSRCTMSNEKQ